MVRRCVSVVPTSGDAGCVRQALRKLWELAGYDNHHYKLIAPSGCQHWSSHVPVSATAHITATAQACQLLLQAGRHLKISWSANTLDCHELTMQDLELRAQCGLQAAMRFGKCGPNAEEQFCPRSDSRSGSTLGLSDKQFFNQRLFHMSGPRGNCSDLDRPRRFQSQLGHDPLRHLRLLKVQNPSALCQT